MASKIRKDDQVEVIAGDHRGEIGKVLRVIREKNQAVVEGVNLVYRHVRPSRRNPQGGRIRKEAPLHLSNLLPVDPKTGRGSRVKFEIEKDARGRVAAKRRVTSGGTTLNEVSLSTKK
jgi:large subunit ribosomal protein L24